MNSRHLFSCDTIARLNNTSMTLKIHEKYLKMQLEKLIRPKKLKRLILKVKILLKQITELCNEHFVSIGDKIAKSIQLGNEQSPTAHIEPATVEFRFNPISVLQVTKVIRKLVNSKVTEIHGIPHKTLKDCAETIAPSLTGIFNFSKETKVSPDDLKVDKVAPAYKSGEKDDLNNYRPISVLPTVARVFEKYSVDKLMTTLHLINY